MRSWRCPRLSRGTALSKCTCLSDPALNRVSSNLSHPRRWSEDSKNSGLTAVVGGGGGGGRVSISEDQGFSTSSFSSVTLPISLFIHSENIHYVHKALTGGEGRIPKLWTVIPTLKQPCLTQDPTAQVTHKYLLNKYMF